MVACTEMDDEAHGVLRRITERGTTRKGYAKITKAQLAKDFDIPWRELTLLLQDLQECGFLIADENSHIQVVERCACVAQSSILASQGGSVLHPAPGHAGARVGSSQGETQPPYGGQGSPPVRRAESAFQTQPPSSTPTAGKISGKRGERAEREEAESAFDLAWMLWRGVKQMRWDHGQIWTGGVAVSPVRNEIARWLREGDVTPALVRAMIEEFCSSPGWLREGVPAWKSFLADRQALTNRCVEAARESGPRATEEDWLRSAPRPVETEEDWLRW